MWMRMQFSNYILIVSLNFPQHFSSLIFVESASFMTNIYHVHVAKEIVLNSKMCVWSQCIFDRISDWYFISIKARKKLKKVYFEQFINTQLQVVVSLRPDPIVELP